jgi:hypothetical protein
MSLLDDSVATCWHDRAPLKRLGKITHERTGERVYVLLCPVCGFTVTTDELRRLRSHRRARSRDAGAKVTALRAPHWA